MSAESESELYTLSFWKKAIAQAVSTSAGAAVSLLINAQVDSIKDAPWYGVASTAIMTGIIVLGGIVSAAGIRDAVPGDVTTREALAALTTAKATGRHAKPDNGDESEA